MTQTSLGSVSNSGSKSFCNPTCNIAIINLNRVIGSTPTQIKYFNLGKKKIYKKSKSSKKSGSSKKIKNYQILL